MKKRTWFVIQGVYVFKNERKPKIMLADVHKNSGMVPDIYPTREEAQRQIDNFFNDEKYWKLVEVVEIELNPVDKEL